MQIILNISRFSSFNQILIRVLLQCFQHNFFTIDILKIKYKTEFKQKAICILLTLLKKYLIPLITDAIITRIVFFFI